jgi:hypothetical protein
MANHLLKSITLGVQRRWWDGLRNGLAAVGAVWTIIEVITTASTSAKLALDAHGHDYLVAMAILFVVVFLAYVVEPQSVSFKVPNTDTKITLKYSDIFEQDANLLIGVNEFFDGELGAPVSKKTVHGQLIIRNFNGSAVSFRAAVDPALAALGVSALPTSRTIEPRKAYPIGTTVSVPNRSHSIFLMAMAHTDLNTSKASSDVPRLWTALRQGLQVVHDNGNGEPLAMPLLGNGQSGVNLEPQHLLRLLVLALVDFATNTAARLPKDVTIVLHESCFEGLDIREIARDWKKG